MKTSILSIIFAAAIAVPQLQAELSLHALFTDHAVIQADLPAPVWGKGDVGAKIKVEFAGQTQGTTVGDDGTWLVTLDPMNSNADGQPLKVSSGDESKTLNDILVGEVWVCSGQSNMAWAVRNTDDAEMVQKEAAANEYAKIRLFKVAPAGEDKPLTDLNISWQLANEETVVSFSATGFYFGRALHKARDTPVGLLQAAMGGTNAYSWINNETYSSDPAAAVSKEWWEEQMKGYPAAKERYEKALAAHKAKGGKGRAPRAPEGPDHMKRPSGHYNAMISPLQPYAIRGAIWYQGERNSRPPFATQYKDLMFALIEDWRADWPKRADGERRDFPFYVVQLPNYANGDPSGWPAVQEQMLKIWTEGKNTGAAITIDVGDPKDIHPSNKLPVGERLALHARATTYGENIVYSGPIYSGVTFNDGAAIVTFDHVGDGLISKDGEPLKYFEIGDADGTFFEPDEIEINGNTVTLKSVAVPNPTAVRYAWMNNPEKPNFFNKNLLPAAPFRCGE
ncbi:MAG: sialate O-acetylesterase [Verrucomicrobiota bacterium]